MPLYEYQCPECGVKVEKLRSINSALEPLCSCLADVDPSRYVIMKRIPSTFVPHDTMVLHHPGGTVNVPTSYRGIKTTVSGGRQ